MRPHPPRKMPKKIASTKKDNPSNANGRPRTSPKRPISPGHNRPISKLSTVPDTAPIANNTADTLDHRLASRTATGSLRTIPRRYITKDHRRERHPEARQDDVPPQRHRHLFTGRQQAWRCVGRQNQ